MMAPTSGDIELHGIGHSTEAIDPSAVGETSHSPNETEIEETLIPPADTGKAAWLVLAGCSLIQAPVWGFPLCSGVFQEYYLSHPDELEGDTTNVAVIGTTVTGIMYLSSPFTFAILTRWPRARPWFGVIGLAMTVCGFLISSFATKVWQLIAMQGVICALGCGLLFTPSTLYLDEWFIKRKGLAYGVMWAGKSITGVGLPFAMEASLRRFGPRITLQAWTVATLFLSAPLLYFLRPRIPLSQSAAVRRIDLKFFRLPAFWMLQTGNILQSLGYFLPYTYLTSYAVQETGSSTTIATLLLALINTTSIPGGIVLGGLGDHMRVTTIIMISSIGSALAVFFFWGFASQVALLAVFSLTYGFFAGGFSSTWSGVLNELKTQSPALDTGLIFGLLAGGRGIGNVISGPLSVALFTDDGWLSNAKDKDWGYGSEYGAIILFTGATSLLGAWGWLGTWCY
ncbi:putative MFS monocarboxylate transporter [Clohesyomyces aquaticus]|uniref:Putative MFS monocarboxylate transporter n=1 Tax=Clohesyomyces aquaticus TaxID=1231657 RepID=A0A1Y1ZS59_9PLEO|nr:putative MFS monocarboxylate transporter [Clohesyomyces aquaticus]